MPLTTEREQRQQDEIIRLADELVRKTAIIADLQAANMELHDRWLTATRPAEPAPHTCAGCGNEIAAEAVAWADGQTWACVECMRRG